MPVLWQGHFEIDRGAPFGADEFSKVAALLVMWFGSVLFSVAVPLAGPRRSGRTRRRTRPAMHVAFVPGSGGDCVAPGRTGLLRRLRLEVIGVLARHLGRRRNAIVGRNILAVSLSLGMEGRRMIRGRRNMVNHLRFNSLLARCVGAHLRRRFGRLLGPGQRQRSPGSDESDKDQGSIAKTGEIHGFAIAAKCGKLALLIYQTISARTGKTRHWPRS